MAYRCLWLIDMMANALWVIMMSVVVSSLFCPEAHQVSVILVLYFKIYLGSVIDSHRSLHGLLILLTTNKVGSTYDLEREVQPYM